MIRQTPLPLYLLYAAAAMTWDLSSSHPRITSSNDHTKICCCIPIQRRPAPKTSVEHRLGLNCHLSLCRYLHIRRLNQRRYFTLQHRAASRLYCRHRYCRWLYIALRRRARHQLKAFSAAIELVYGAARARASTLATSGMMRGHRWNGCVDDLLAVLAQLSFYTSDLSNGVRDNLQPVVQFLVQERERSLQSAVWSLWDYRGYARDEAAVTWAITTRRFLQDSGSCSMTGGDEIRVLLQECAMAFLSSNEFPARQTEMCVICTEAVTEQSSSSMTYCHGRADCARIFHESCIAAWVNVRVQSRHIPRCPVCNKIWVATLPEP